MRRYLIGLAVLSLVLAAAVTARVDAAAAPFDPKAFAAAQSEGKSIVVHVHATW
jgi:hypothetical protein